MSRGRDLASDRARVAATRSEQDNSMLALTVSYSGQFEFLERRQCTAGLGGYRRPWLIIFVLLYLTFSRFGCRALLIHGQPCPSPYSGGILAALLVRLQLVGGHWGRLYRLGRAVSADLG